jgi:competence protein ComEC
MDRKIFVLGALLLFDLIATASADPGLKITFLDVGEGEAIVLQHGNDTALIDSGNPLTGRKVLSFLEQQKIQTLSHVFITHPHLDHMGGIFHLLPTIEMTNKYDNGQEIPSQPDISRWYAEAFRSSDYRALVSGDSISIGSISLTAFNPPEEGGGSANQQSLVLLLQHGSVRMLFMADADKKVEKRLLNSGVNVKARLLKVGHHGASDASSREFLAAVDPLYAVVSINKDNIRSYPSPDVIDQLGEQGIQLFTTYNEGDISFVSDGKNLSIVTH